jgi:hypothetical protein
MTATQTSTSAKSKRVLVVLLLGLGLVLATVATFWPVSTAEIGIRSPGCRSCSTSNAEASGKASLAAEIRQRLELYRAGQPYRETASPEAR